MTKEDKKILDNVSKQIEMVNGSVQNTDRSIKKVNYKVERLSFLMAVVAIILLFKWYT